MEVKDLIVVAVDFHEDPGARDEDDGINSGAVFLRDILRPKFVKAKDSNYLLMIDLDGVFGYPSSFVSGSFGALSMEFGAEEVLKHLRFKSERRPIRIDKIILEIKEPER